MCAGVLVRQEGKGHWAALKRAFRLLVDEVDDQNPTDAAYVFSGHCPLTVRLVLACAQAHYRPAETCMQTCQLSLLGRVPHTGFPGPSMTDSCCYPMHEMDVTHYLGVS